MAIINVFTMKEEHLLYSLEALVHLLRYFCPGNVFVYIIYVFYIRYTNYIIPIYMYILHI